MTWAWLHRPETDPSRERGAPITTHASADPSLSCDADFAAGNCAVEAICEIIAVSRPTGCKAQRASTTRASVMSLSLACLGAFRYETTHTQTHAPCYQGGEKYLRCDHADALRTSPTESHPRIPPSRRRAKACAHEVVGAVSASRRSRTLLSVALFSGSLACRMPKQVALAQASNERNCPAPRC